MARKIRQLHIHNDHLFAIATDGTLWEKAYDTGWESCADLPARAPRRWATYNGVVATLAAVGVWHLVVGLLRLVATLIEVAQ